MRFVRGAFGVLIVVSTLTVLPQAATAVPGQVEWVDRREGLDGGAFDSVTELVPSPDGSAVYVAGRDGGSGQGEDAVIRALDPASGAELWAARHQTAADDVPVGLAVSDALVVIGVASLAEDYVSTLVAYDRSTGSQAWAVTRAGNASISSLAITADGSTVVVAGGRVGRHLSRVWTMAAYEASTGAPIWTATYRSRNRTDALVGEVAWDMVLTPDGSTAIVVGTVARPNGYVAARVVALDVATGEERWRLTQPGGRERDAIPAAVDISPDGSRGYATGWVERRRGLHDLGSDVLTFAFDIASGGELWGRTSGGRRGDETYDVVSAPDGSAVYVAGYGRGSRMLVEAIDAAEGTVLWRSLIAGPNGASAFAREIAIAPDGAEVYVTGFHEPTRRNVDSSTVALDALSGDQLWHAIYASPGSAYDATFDIGAAPDGSRVYAGGTAGRRSEHLVVAYSTE